jgi:hypothetical protein
VKRTLFISRRTAVRRLVRLRAKAEATSNQQTIVWFMDQDVVDPVTLPCDPGGQHEGNQTHRESPKRASFGQGSNPHSSY